MSSPPPDFVRHTEHFAVERRNGVLLLRMHTGGGPAVMSLGLHRALGEVLQEAPPCAIGRRRCPVRPATTSTAMASRYCAISSSPWQRRLVDDLAFGRAHHLLTT